MITQQQIDQVIQTIVEEYQPEKIFLFGSYAYGEPTKESDLDLLIIKKSNDRFNQRSAEVRELLEAFHFPIEILVYTPQEFEKSSNTFCTIAFAVNEKGKVVYGS